jgi:hypothetical protein
MKKKLCAQLWQAEAVEDGRLSGAERASFERHAMHCESCSRELADLANLREIMAHTSAAESTPFERRRMRMGLLERADREIETHTTSSTKRVFVFAMAAAACVLLVIFGSRLSSRRSATVETTASPAFDVTESGAAKWSSERLGAMTRVNLTEGAMWIHVERTRSEQRFVLTLPDGDIEVHGTRFLTVVDKGNTNHVQVTEGVVSLRLRGEPDRTLRAGDTWDRPIAQQPAAATSPAASTHGNAANGRPQKAARPATEPEKANAEPAVDPFVVGVQAFRNGDYASADEHLARFARSMPTDPRIEDAFFLRAVANSRQGKKAVAADLARSYLSRFPRGLRRPEAERIAGQAQGGQLPK